MTELPSGTEGTAAGAEVVDLVPRRVDDRQQAVVDLLVVAVERHLDQIDRAVRQLLRSGSDERLWHAAQGRSLALRQVIGPDHAPDRAPGGLPRLVRRLQQRSAELLAAVRAAGAVVRGGPDESVRAVPFDLLVQLLDQHAFAPGHLPSRWSSEAVVRSAALLDAKVRRFVPTAGRVLPAPEPAAALLALGLPVLPGADLGRPVDRGILLDLLGHDVSVGPEVRRRLRRARSLPDERHLLDLAAALYVDGRTPVALAVLCSVPTPGDPQRRLAVRRLRALWTVEAGRATDGARFLLEVLDHLADDDPARWPLVAAEVTACAQRSGRPLRADAVAGGRRPATLSPVGLRAAALGLDERALTVLSLAAGPTFARGEAAGTLSLGAAAAVSGLATEDALAAVALACAGLRPAGPTAAAPALPLAAGDGGMFTFGTPGDATGLPDGAPPAHMVPVGTDDGAMATVIEVDRQLADLVTAAIACGVALDRPSPGHLVPGPDAVGGAAAH